MRASRRSDDPTTVDALKQDFHNESQNGRAGPFCAANRGSSASARRPRLPPGRTWTDELKCRQASAEPTPEESPLPTLLAPEHTTMTGEASLRGYGVRGFAATMRSETPLPELLAHLLGQLHTQGWSEVDRALGRDGAIVSLRRDGVAAALSGVRGAAGDFLFEFRVLDS
jgi:hypothetical protein